MAGRFHVEAVLSAVDKITRPLEKMGRGFGKFSRKAEQNLRIVGVGFDKLSRKVKRFGIVSVAALTALGVAARSIVTPGAEFGRAIGSAAAKFDGGIQRGTEAFKALGRTARDVGATTEFTAVQAAEGLNFLAKAGFSAESAMRSLRPIVDFATASQIDFATAADIASDVLGAFGLDSENTEEKLKGLNRVMDVMSKTANSSNVTVEEMFETIKDAGPISKVTGGSIETFSALLAFLANSGIKASKAGTATKNMLLALAGEANKASDVFASLGISLTDGEGNLRDQLDVLDEMSIALNKLTNKERIALLNEAFGLRAVAAGAIVTDGATKSIRAFRKELIEAKGNAFDTAKFIRNDVKGSMDSLFSAVEGVKISIFSLNEGPLKETIDGLTDWIRANEKFIAQNIGETLKFIIENLGTIAKWIGAIGAAMAVFFTLNTVLQTLIGIFTLLNIVMALNPIGLIVIGITAAIGVITALVVWTDELLARFEKMPFVVKLLLLPFKKLLDIIKLVKDGFSALANSRFGRAIGDALGFGEEEKAPAPTPTVISPQERVSKSISETRETTNNTLTIKDETGRGELTTTGNQPPAFINLVESGAF
jgi:TP901 family phage tail tape measure protein